MTQRYTRLERFRPIGVDGVKRLREAHVVIIGMGALGASQAEMLVRSGIGKLTIIDRDYVDTTNLQRQQLYTEQDVKRHLPKAYAAKNHLEAINSEVEIEVAIEDLFSGNADRLLSNADLLLDGTDNFETRQLINDFSHRHGIPWIYGAATASYGVMMPIIPGKTPCFHCLFSHQMVAGETCETAGIIGPAVQMTVALQLSEAMKLLTGHSEAIRHGLTTYDIWKNEQTTIRLDGLKVPHCPTCGVNPSYPFLKGDYESKTAVLCGRETVQVRPTAFNERQYTSVVQSLEKLEMIRRTNDFLTQFEADGHIVVLFKDGRALIHGTSDPLIAKNLYQRYVGS
ncbi:ThiF family adenylyltransferase [Pullulanibacillus sp. KACC 23026]|uniref:ThiF family adenylyltransferase n=1 Tax=Pullulanibacillus sp. KACC 23026 TaxID=3028315 RepID=UPI0023AEFBF1|nr:ThiF family adenylyltransferase [Pullulanibacillus sp. KACC 23026]WEG10851.1 ThiF family adenylyltransferase [Pullulanibacillus sp. KACC 23026]